MASPGDLEAERRAAKIIVDEENINHANAAGYHLDLVGWEDTVSQRRRAQEAINQELDQCEYFVGLMWKKWGSPPGPQGHPYSSGFEEEYRRSGERFDQTGKPEISLLFKHVEKEDLADPGSQLRKVIEFQETVSAEKNQLYQKFTDIRDFEQRFRSIIAKFLRDQRDEDLDLTLGETSKDAPLGNQEPQTSGETEIVEFFDIAVETFLTNFLRSGREFTASDVARFRLLSTVVSKPGNDQSSIGTHDANLLYLQREESTLSDMEARGIIAAGLSQIDNATIPLWSFLFSIADSVDETLALLTLIGPEKVRRGAFKAMAYLKIEPNIFGKILPSLSVGDVFFVDSKSTDLQVATLDYIGCVGRGSLNVDWERLLSNPEANIVRSAVRCRARILLRSSAVEAYDFIASRPDIDLGDRLTRELLLSAKAVETNVLRSCLTNRTIYLVRGLAQELVVRDGLTESDALGLCDSSDARTRLLGVSYLRRNSELSIKDAKAHVIKPKKAAGIGILPSGASRDFEGEEAFEFLQIEELGKLGLDALDARIAEENFYSHSATLATYASHFKRSRSEFETNLIDGFFGFLSKRTKEVEGTKAEPTQSLFEFVRRELLQSAFEVYCRRVDRSGLSIVRDIIDQNRIKYSSEIVHYLGRYGSWADAQRISKLCGEQKYFGFGAHSFLSSNFFDEYALAASTLLKIGAARFVDLWQLELPEGLRLSIVRQMPEAKFKAFDDGKIVEMLRWETDRVREVVALKTVICLSKERIASILERYTTESGTYFYNAVFWLDLGIAASKSLSKAAARERMIEIE